VLHSGATHMVLSMSRPHRRRGSRFFQLRQRVPADLVSVVGKREVSFSLKTDDPSEAKRLQTQELAKLQAHWDELRRKHRIDALRDNDASQDKTEAVSCILSERDAYKRAEWMYGHRLTLHRENPSQQRFWPTELYQHMWKSSKVSLSCQDNGKISVQANISFAQADKICQLEKWCLEHAETVLYVHEIATDDASTIRVAKAIAAQVQRASLTLIALAHGAPEPTSSPTQPATAATRPTPVSSKLSGLVEAWWREAEKTGKSASTYESYSNTMRLLTAFLGHDDAQRVTADEIVRFKDHRLASKKRNGEPLSATTVRNSDLAALKAIFGWAVNNRRLPENPAAGVTVPKVAKVKLREREFTTEEARTLLRAASQLRPGRELPQTYAAKRWIPWLLAFTGARVGEIAQMRRQDLRKVEIDGHPDGVWVLRITPEAGTVKTKQAREVPLHPQLVELGFIDFVERAPGDRLFLVPDAEGKVTGQLGGLKNRLTEFARQYVSDSGVSPNHSWRHRFRTIATEAGVASNVIDAICGWSARSVGERYGSISLKARADAVSRLPNISL
jgi:integrase